MESIRTAIKRIAEQAEKIPEADRTELQRLAIKAAKERADAESEN